jgi:hypothetical protein
MKINKLYGNGIAAVMLILLISTASACKCRKDQKSTAVNPVVDGNTAVIIPDSAKNAEQQLAILAEPTHRLVVSFISIGEGTFAKGKEQLNQYIESAQLKYKIYLNHVSKGWGREGESDVIFSLNELTPEQQSDFINGLRELFKGNQLILIEENSQARKYR